MKVLLLYILVSNSGLKWLTYLILLDILKHFRQNFMLLVLHILLEDLEDYNFKKSLKPAETYVNVLDKWSISGQKIHLYKLHKFKKMKRQN